MINAGEMIKNFRSEYKLSQEKLARAIHVETPCISYWENSKREPSLEMLEKIANVFGYTINLTLVEKKEGLKPKNFYLDKSGKEICSMTHNDLVDYIFVTQPNDVIANICKTTLEIIELLPLEKVKELISNKIENVNRLAIYFKINKLHSNMEENMAYFTDIISSLIPEMEDIEEDIINAVEYIEITSSYDDEGCYYCEEGSYYFSYLRLLDKDKKVLPVDSYDICGHGYTPLDADIDSDLSEYLGENSPYLIKLNY